MIDTTGGKGSVEINNTRPTEEDKGSDSDDEGTDSEEALAQE